MRNYHFKMITSVATMMLFVSTVYSVEVMTEPSSDQGIPNSSVTVAASQLDTAETYKIWLKLALSGTTSYFDVGSTDDFSGVASHSETIDVTYNPGPGTHPGRAQLKKNLMGSYGDVVAEIGFKWIGPAM